MEVRVLSGVPQTRRSTVGRTADYRQIAGSIPAGSTKFFERESNCRCSE